MKWPLRYSRASWIPAFRVRSGSRGLLTALLLLVLTSGGVVGNDALRDALGEEKGSRITLSQVFFLGNPSHYQPSRYRTWFRGFGNWTSVGNSGKSADLDYSSSGFSLGVDRQIGQNLLIGAGLGGNWISAKGENLKRKGRLESDVSAIHASIYIRKSWSRLYFDLETGFGKNDQSRPGRLDAKLFQWNVNAETGTSWGHGLAKVEPFFGLRHVSLDTAPGSESKTTLLGGFRYSWKTTGIYATVTPRFYGGVMQELGGRKLMNAGVFVDSPTVFTLPGYEVAETRFFFGGGFTSTLGRSLDLSLRYTAEVASSHASHTVLLGMNWNF